MVQSERGDGTDGGDRAAVLAAAADYIESWLDGDADRMAGCLHPDLAKRAVDRRDPAAPVDTMTRQDMVDDVASGGGRGRAREYDAEVLDLYRDIATVRVTSAPFVDYLHLARFGDRWLLLNVLYQGRAGEV